MDLAQVVCMRQLGAGLRSNPVGCEAWSGRGNGILFVGRSILTPLIQVLEDSFEKPSVVARLGFSRDEERQTNRIEYTRVQA